MPVSRQKIQADLALNSTRYDHFTALNFTGHDLRANWWWQAGDRTSGSVGYSENSSLASFAKLLGTTPDHVNLRDAYASGTSLLSPDWRVGARLNGLAQRNSDPAQQINDVNILGTEVTASYLSRAGNTLALVVREEDGRFPNPQPVGGALIDNAYRQPSAGIAVDWTISAASQLSARLDRVRRRYSQVPQRDFDGSTWRAEYRWNPTTTFSLSAVAQHDISPYEYNRSAIVMVHGITLRPTLTMSAATELSGIFGNVSRRYLGDPAVALGLASERVDRVRAAGALISYRPVPAVTLQLSAQRERRASNVTFGDYDANVVSFSARIAF
jgi:hypothetical protein